jgi:hypothetical protein
VHTTLGIALGALGNIADGLREYEWRLRLKGWNPPRFSIPAWGGEPLSGKRLLVWSEQGLGDNLQFVRFTALAKQRGASVLFHGDPRLVRLFASCAGIAQAHSLHGPRPSADLHASLLSLPALLDISNEAVTTSVPYLHAEAALATTWRAHRRASSGARPRVALAWQGNPAFCDDERRSLSLALFVPLLRELGSRIEFVSLQKGFGQDQLRWLPNDTPVADLGAALDNGGDAFVDSAAALESIDLMLTSDTALAHLAGALARPVWTLLARVPDWRWGLGSATTSWYPTMRLFRQQHAGDWRAVIAEVTLALRSWADQQR